MLSDMSQSQKDEHGTLPFIRGIESSQTHGSDKQNDGGQEPDRWGHGEMSFAVQRNGQRVSVLQGEDVLQLWHSTVNTRSTTEQDTRK